MATLSEMIILWHSLLHDFYIMCAQFNDGVIDKESGPARIIKTFEYKDIRMGFRCCDHWERKEYIRKFIYI